MKNKYIASVSFGKDSLAMLLMLIEKQYPLDEVVFYDTGMEFKCIYNIRNQILPLLEKHNIKYIELKPKQPFLYTMFEKPVNVGKENEHKGYSWCGGVCRWGTTEKLKAIAEYSKGSYEYIGIAADEIKRIQKERTSNKLMPLVEWHMTEKDCLKYCYSNGYYWIEDGIELYEILDRVSCWCCANKNLKELKNYYLYLPQYWQKLKDLQSKTKRKFKKNYSITELEIKFNEEKL